MSQYTLTVFGKKREISKEAFYMIVIPILAFWMAYIWCLCGGVYRFGETFFDSGMLTVFVSIILFGAITINDIRYALLPENTFTKYLIRVLSYSAIIYYVYNVTTYGF